MCEIGIRFYFATIWKPFKNLAHPAREAVHKFGNQQRPLLLDKRKVQQRPLLLDKREGCWEFPKKRLRQMIFTNFKRCFIVT